MKILISGGAGFIGFNLVKKLSEGNNKIVIIDDFSRGKFDKEFTEYINKKNIKLFDVNLVKENALDKLDKDFEFIIHLAAILGVENVVKDSFKVLNNNFLMTSNLINFAKLNSKLRRFIYASTSEVYSGTLKSIGLIFPTPESTEIVIPSLIKPRTSYMLSKIYGEALCHSSGLPISIVRPHNVYGPRMGFSHVIPELILRVNKLNYNDQLEVFSPSHKRVFCFIDDAIKLLIYLLKNSKDKYKIFNLGNNNDEICMRDLAKIILTVMDRNDIKIVDGSNTDGSPERRIPDITKITEYTGIKERVSLERGISKTYDWYKYQLE